MESQVNIARLKAHLSEYLRAVRKGNEILIQDRDTPVAKLVPVKAARRPKLQVIPATKSPAELAKLSCLHVEGLRLEDIAEALAEDRRDWPNGARSR